MFDPDTPEEETKPAVELTPAQLAHRARAKKRNIIAVVVSFGICAILGVISVFLPEGPATGWMFASYAAGYVGVLWGVAGLWTHYMKSPPKK